MELAIEDGIEKEKAKLNKEWYKLIHEEDLTLTAMYEYLIKVGRWTPTLDGPKAPEIQAIEAEFKLKYDDVFRRYGELVKGKTNTICQQTGEWVGAYPHKPTTAEINLECKNNKRIAFAVRFFCA